MIYKSKKDKNILAKVVEQDEERKTVILEYITGEQSGKTFNITTSTLKRWWSKVNESEIESIDISVETPKEIPSVLKNLDYEKINTPYPEPKEQKYIPKPKSVIEYEEKKKKVKCEIKLPDNYEDFATELSDKNIKIQRVNKGYLALEDTTKLKLLSTGIGVLATDKLGNELSLNGLQCRECIEKGTPFRFDIKTQEQYDKLITVLQTLYNTQEEN